MMPPHIVFVHLYNDRSGSPRVLAQVITALHRAGRSGELLTSGHSDGCLSAVPVRRRRLFYQRSENHWLTLFWYALGQTLLFFQCLRYWPRNVCFYINTMMPAGAALAAWLMGKPVIYHVHETSIRPPLFKRCLRAVIRLTADKVVFVSGFLRQAEGFVGKEQRLLYNAVEPPVEPEHSKSGFDVLMVCSLKAYKGVDEFVYLASGLQHRAEMRFTLVLNADQIEIDRYFSTFALPDNLTLVARQQDVTPFYCRASVLLNLSRPDEWVETFGLTIVEAMGHGLPVIVPPVGGPAEIVRDGVEGFLVQGTDTQTVTAHLERWLTDPDCYRAFSQRARARAADFCPQAFKRALLDIVD
ncbi:glycosyltransferase family 4 protein [Oceanisphaera arctica]|uniref:Uncharacterized protein n=1 Tax=Oceanisphaera arctica TaxID=641510 RepID=A0A2P5TLG7_9GAMM|nr:glycosyltransferase family 4 protein [Oceanisphaera arctica]PPL16168.1 hypothetical protein UN63_10020 [Oceanisphaera arctica]GHA06368.1 hypothetical protein GCM10007082_04250 [Oceanisphaera arctica]